MLHQLDKWVLLGRDGVGGSGNKDPGEGEGKEGKGRPEFVCRGTRAYVNRGLRLGLTGNAGEGMESKWSEIDFYIDCVGLYPSLRPRTPKVPRAYQRLGVLRSPKLYSGKC